MLTSIRVRPQPVAIGRILLALGVALASFEGAALLSQLQDGRILTPVADQLPSAAQVPVLPWLAVMAIGCVCLLLGLFTSTSLVVLALGHLALLSADHQLYSNHRFILVLLCLWFAFARSDRAYAIGARTRREGDGGTVRWWPQLLVIATISACYLFAGLSKANPEFLTGQMIGSMSPHWVPDRLAAYATVPTEICIGLGIWWWRTRRPALVLGVALHLSIIILLGSVLVFTAFALLCASGYPLIWSWRALTSPPDQPQADAAATHRSSVA